MQIYISVNYFNQLLHYTSDMCDILYSYNKAYSILNIRTLQIPLIDSVLTDNNGSWLKHQQIQFFMFI